MTRSFVRRHLGRGACAAALAVVLAAPAQAQTPQPKPTGTAKPEAAQKPPTTPAPQPAQKPPQPARPASSPARPAGPPMFSFQAFGDVGLTGFAAKSSFDALFGSSSGATFGGGAQIAHRRGYFVRFDLSRFTATGERAFVHEGEVFKLGIPLKLTLTPIEFTAGYRFVARQRVPRPPAPRPATPRKSVASGEQPRPGSATPGPAPRRPLRRWVPYVGGGFGTMQYEETSSLATTGESESTSFSSYHVLGGVDVPIWKFIGLGVEAHYRWVPDALGADGVSKEFEDKDLGGYSFRLRLTLGR